MMDRIAESDWKLLRQFHPVARDRFCQRVLSEVRDITTDQESSPQHRYLALFDLIMRRNTELADSFNDLRRSNAILKLACIRAHELLTDDEFGEFTLATRNAISTLIEAQSS